MSTIIKCGVHNCKNNDGTCDAYNISLSIAGEDGIVFCSGYERSIDEE